MRHAVHRATRVAVIGQTGRPMSHHTSPRPRPRGAPGGSLLADLHAHTTVSDGHASVRETLLAAERLGWLDVLAITDHDRIEGGIEAQRVAAGEGLRLEVVAGEEITTRGGHLLGLYVTELVRPHLPVPDAIRAIHDQGGLAVPAHPLFPYRACLSIGAIRRAAEDPQARIDGLEAHNPTALGRLMRGRVRALGAELDIALIGGSDSHTSARIGLAWTAFESSRLHGGPVEVGAADGGQADGEPGSAAAALRRAIEGRTTSSGGIDDPLLAGVPLALGQAAGALRGRVRTTS